MDIDVKAAFREAKKINGLSLADLHSITGENPQTLKTWLYDPGRTPSWRAVYLLFSALGFANGKIPRDIGREVGRYAERARRWGKKNRLGDSVEYIGEKRFEVGAHQFFYDGERLTVAGIAKTTGLTYSQVRHLVRELSLGSDVTRIVHEKLAKGSETRGRNKSK